ncbi:MAG TPA: hypothetical protein VNQ76_02900 [Planctomicrobium sp.]|nr:hypothetical protein [Planctomicrobium sp.]
MPQLTLGKLKQQLKTLDVGSNIEHLRKQIAGRKSLRAEVDQLAIELRQRQEKVDKGELPAYSTWEIRREIDARLKTLNIDYDIKIINDLSKFNKDAQLILNKLHYDEREASWPAQKARDEFRNLRPLMEQEVRRQEEAIRRYASVIRGGPWEPDPPHEREQRKMIAVLEQFKETKENEIRSAEKTLNRLTAAYEEARYNMEFFRHWAFTGSLDGPQKPTAVSALTTT